MIHKPEPPLPEVPAGFGLNALPCPPPDPPPVLFCASELFALYTPAVPPSTPVP